MKIQQATSRIPCYTSIMNLYHLFYIHNVKEVLVDTRCRKYVDGVFTLVSQLKVDFNITEPVVPDYLRARDVDDDSVPKFLLDSPLKQKYDLFVVHTDNVVKLIPFMHRCLFLFVVDEKDSRRKLLPYTKINDCFEGVVYVNDFHSIVFPTAKLDVYQQTYVRDKPYRFLRKMQQLLLHFECKTIVEIGSCRTRLRHDLDDINPVCCNDSHSTFFWCECKATVYTVDVNPLCETVLQDAYQDRRLRVKGKLEIVNEDGLTFLRDYEGDPIDFLFLDAWDVIFGTDYALKHLEAYQTALDKLSKDRCFLGIDDTDIAMGGKGRLLIPRLIEDGWTLIHRGRHSIFYKGPLEDLVA